MATRLRRTDEVLSVGELAARSGVSVSALHFYERQGLIHGGRNAGNQRRYGREVLRRVAIIKVAQRAGIPLASIREALDTLPDGRTPTTADWTRLSRRWRAETRRADRPAHATARPARRLHRLRLPVAAGLPVAQSGRCRRGAWTGRAVSRTMI